jgi:hypothetical protein
VGLVPSIASNATGRQGGGGSKGRGWVEGGVPG